jgi:hypothetical protein
MLSKEEILNLLLGQNNLWEEETRHEAMLLYKSLYEKYPESREVLIDHVLKGPPTENVEEDLKERLKYDVFELLEYLQESGLELTNSGKRQLEEMKNNHPKWELSPDADISAPFHIGRHENPFTVEEIHSKKPSEVSEILKSYEGSWERSRRDLCITVGMTCHQYPDWALELFGSLKNIIKELPADTINPIISGLQLSDDVDKAAWDKEGGHNLLNLLEIMISEKPEAEFWTGLPSLLKNWLKILKIDADFWGKLAKKLVEIFIFFDYQREKEKIPVEWFQRSANHPYGDLTELYLEHAYQLIINQKEKGIKFELDSKTLDFFTYTIKNYALGSRYGVCILGHWLGWLEAVAPEWTEKNLIPIFYWDDNKERALVSWSGYLWNRRLSRFLSEGFSDTYLNAGRHYKEFANSEQEGLIVHVAGLLWFKDIDISDLKDFATMIDGKGRREMLWTWENHLEKAQKEVAEDFWKRVIIPYWDWTQKRYFGLPDGNEEKFSFWRLLPFSYSLFPQAAERAINFAPTSIESEYLFPKKLLESRLSKSYPEDFTNILVAFIRADQHPEWHEEEWQQLWNDVKDSGAQNLNKLKDELARHKIKIEEI